MKFPLERLQIIDTSVVNDDKITLPCFDVSLSFFNKSEAVTVRDQIIRSQKLFKLIEDWIDNPDDFDIPKTTNGLDNIGFTLLILGRLHELSKPVKSKSLCECGCNCIIGSNEFQKKHVELEKQEIQREELEKKL